METINWSLFKKRIHIAKPAAEVYSAWAIPSKLEQWFLEQAKYVSAKNGERDRDDFVRKGDRFIWKWNNWDFVEKGEVIKADGSAVSFTFGQGGIVLVEFHEIDGLTEVILTQENIPTDEKSKMEQFVGCSTGWTFWLTNLKAWLEHGITLHAKGLSQKETTDLVNS